MSKWYVPRDGAWVGPYDSARLHELASAGQLVPTDFVAREGTTAGILAKDADIGVSWPGRAKAQSTGLATRARRLGAVAIDSALSFAVATPLIVMSVVAAVDGMNSVGPPDAAGSLLSLAATLIAMIGSLALFGVQAYFLTTRGQTIGKRLVRIRIVMDDTGELGGFWRIVGVRLLLNAVFAAWPPYAIADTLYIFGEQQKCLHDRIARTKVVSV